MTRVKIETIMSKPLKTRKGVPQGGLGSSSFWREYKIDIVMSIFESKEWEIEVKKDEEQKKRELRGGKTMVSGRTK
jgi:hypothetical protein